MTMNSKVISYRFIFICFLIILGLFLLTKPINAENTVLIKDIGLKNAIEEKLQSTPISLESLKSIVELDANNH
jgi:regulatory protein YycI of two-component signal transduction system YycFG